MADQPSLTLAQSHITSLISYLPPSSSSYPIPLSPIIDRAATLPYVTLTYAQSLDAQISLNPGTPTILSGSETKAMTHFLRAHHVGILVGVGTAMADNPRLGSRWRAENESGINGMADMGEVEGEKNGLKGQPVPIVLDPMAKMDWDLTIPGDFTDSNTLDGARSSSNTIRTIQEDSGNENLTIQSNNLLRLHEAGTNPRPIWLVQKESYDTLMRSRLGFAKIQAFENHGGRMLTYWSPSITSSSSNPRVPASSNSSSIYPPLPWHEILTSLSECSINSVMIEGGGRIISSLLQAENQKYINSVIVTVAPIWLGKGGVETCPEREKEGRSVGRLKGVRWIGMGEDVVVAGRF